MGPGLMLLQGVGAMSVPSLTSGFSIHMHLLTDSPFPPAIGNMKTSKKRDYEQRVREIEHGSFTPLVMSLTGGLGRAANVCYKRLASLIATKQDQPYSSTIAWIRCRLSFSLLRSSIQCIRGARSAIGRAARQQIPPTDLVSAEAGISYYL